MYPAFLCIILLHTQKKYLHLSLLKLEMSLKKITILNAKEIAEKTTRMAYQILEDNFEEDNLVFAGIADRGYVFAKRLKDEFERISLKKVKLVKIVVDKDSSSLQGNTNGTVEEASNKVLILVDDVLNSGRTLAYGLGLFLDIPLKKMRVAVLIDRSHQKFPILSDFTGLKLSTVLKEHVTVFLDEKDFTKDVAYLI